MQTLAPPGPTPQTGNWIQEWSQRKNCGVGSSATKPFGSQFVDTASFGIASGPALEVMVAVANSLNKNLWVNVPFRASDDCMLKFIQTLKWGSNGVNPYTGAYGSTYDAVWNNNPYPSAGFTPEWPGVNPGLKIYIEWFNEIWNYQESANSSAANSANAAFHYNSTYGGYDRVGGQIAKVSLLCRKVFGDSDMMTRVRPILAGQMANIGHVQDGAEYIKRVWGSGNSYSYPANATSCWATGYNPGIGGTSGQPLNWYIWAIAGAPYLGADNGTTPANFRTYYTQQVQGWMTTHNSYALTNNVKVCCYEGGFEAGSSSGAVTTMTSAVGSSTGNALQQLITDYLTYWYSLSQSDLFCYYALATNYASGELYGLSDNLTNNNTPQYAAITAVAATIT